MTAFEEKAGPSKGLRCSFPPYFVGVMLDGVPVVSLPGELYEMVERGFAPTAEETRRKLVRLRQELCWSRAALAAFLGVSRAVLRRWETGERRPSGAARRLIWMLDLLAREPEKLKSAMDLIVWGKRDELKGISRGLETI